MRDKSGPRGHTFTVINQNAPNEPWDGSPVTLLPNQSSSMATTPVGSVIFAYQNISTGPTPATLAVTSGGSQPLFLNAPAMTNQPLTLVRNWYGNNFNVTNITPPEFVAPVLVQMIGPGMPGLTPVELPVDGVAVALTSGQAVQGETLAHWMQVILQANSGALTILVIIGGPPDAAGNNSFVIALNASQESGPGTGTAPPEGYYATTTGAVYTYQLNWGTAPILVVNMSAETTAPAGVGLRAL